MNNPEYYYDSQNSSYVYEAKVQVETYFYVANAQQIAANVKFYSLDDAIKVKPTGGLIGLVVDGINRGMLSISDLIDASSIKCGTFTKIEKRRYPDTSFIQEDDIYINTTNYISNKSII